MRVGVTRELRAIIDGGTVAGLTDGQLLERFASHRGAEAEPAFTALVMRHGPLVFGVCQSLLRNPHDAEDAFQATFMVLARKAGSIRQPDRLGPWLHGVAHRTARRLKDKNARRKSYEAEAAVYSDRAHPSSGSSQHPSALANHDEIEALHREIERLPARYKTAIVLCDLQGLTHEEAARRLGRRVGTISSQVSRARTAAPPARSPRAGLPGRNCRCRDRLDKALGAPERACRFHRQERDVFFHRARGRERPGLDRQSFPGSLEIHAIRENRTDRRRGGRLGSRCHGVGSVWASLDTLRSRHPQQPAPERRVLNPEPIAVAARKAPNRRPKKNPPARRN